MKINSLKKNHIKSEINITPFTDVVLVLLIIFMITTPMIIQSNITVNIPKSKYGEPGKNEQFEVVIKGEKEIYYNNKITDMITLKHEMITHARRMPDIPLVIRADRNIKYYMLVDMMDMAKESGIKKISLNVEKP